MSFKLKLFAVVAGLLVVVSGTLFFVRQSQAEKVVNWVTVDAEEFGKVRNELAGKGVFSLQAVEVQAVENGIALLELDESQMEDLSRGMHESFHKCSGFMAHQSREEAVDSIRRLAAVDPRQQFVTYTIDNQTVVNALLAEANEASNRQVIIDLSAFPNRRHNLQGGLDGADWIKNRWTALAAGRSDVSVDYFTHPVATTPQPSVIMTIQGATLPNEIVVVGAHQDSINTSGQTQPAPGADDDASGVSCLTETIRVLMAKNFRPQRTVKFMAYAAEEVGLKGSADIATNFRNQNLNVVGVLQMDMTNYKGTPAYDIVLFQDFVNAPQNTFLQNLITTYQPTLAIGTSSCGYACSDHASWTNKSYPASMPGEATFADTNSVLHTVNDLISRSGNNANHALKFTKLALSYVGELAKSASARKPPVDFDGDSKTDVSIFRPGSGEWWYSKSSNGGNAALTFGTASDRLVPADYTGDGKTDIAFWRPASGFWYVLRSENNTFFSFPFGASTDTPVIGDFDGDGKTDPTVVRPSTNEWFISKTTGGTSIVTFGAAGDLPVPADYDGDGKTDVAIYRPSVGEWWINRSTTNVTYAFQFGTSTDKLVPGDYTGDGKADAAFFRPSTGFWYILRSEDSSFFSFPFGATGDSPSPGDYDGDGKFDPAVFRPSVSTWYVNRTTSGLMIQTFGAAGDVSVPNAFVP
ncbi:MAG: M20/M25/M40 family metallo-hydrolase [Acidobacteria bacterium]|nr:M20/M25/M40 family metallo-hydrolase [Acidobacteriota bacterium]